MMTINSIIINSHKRRSNQAGMTLIEIMIALLLGLFLIAGLLQIFVNNKQSYRLAEAQSRLQENARYALEMLNHDIRLSGFMGCSVVRTTGTLNPVVIANDPLVAPVPHTGIPAVVGESVITGGNDNGGTFDTPQPALSSSPLNDATMIRGTDAITVQFAESCGGYVTTPISTTNIDWTAPDNNIATTSTCGITLGTGTNFGNIGTPLVISDCSTAHIFRASANNGQNKDSTGNLTNIFGPVAAPKTYPAGSEVLLFRSYTYYIRLGASGQPALWRLNNNYPVTLNSNPEEMIEGIENMQITYGWDSDATPDGSANQYIIAPTALQWPNVVSVRIILTVRSIEDNLLPVDNPDRSYNNINTHKDRRLVKTFTTTIGLRNR